MKPLRSSIVFSIFVSLSLPAMAQSTWNGTTSTNWSVATNWAPGIPASGDNITIADTTANALTLDDGSHTVGSITIGTNGTRTSAFNLQTNAANTLTIAGGVVANGNFGVGTGTRLRGNLVISADQTWQVLGSPGAAGTTTGDSGIAINEVASGSRGSLVLNANLNKSGPGQLSLGGTVVSGAADIRINEGSLKLNAGGSLLLTVGGPGKIAVNNSATLQISKNSGTFSITRPLQFNNTSKLETGSGAAQTGTVEIPANMEWNGIHTVTNSTNTGNVAINYQFSGVMSGPGSFTKTGASQLVLSGTAANTISGQITVAGGELSLDKTDVIAVPGNILVTGGTLRVNKPNQIADSSGITVNGTGALAYTAARAETIASLAISSTATSSVSGYTVTGATTISGGLQQLNSGETFTTNSLAISNNATLQMVGQSATVTSSLNVGSGGLTLDNGTVAYGNPGMAGTSQVNLSGNVTSTGTSLFSSANYDGPRLIDLQGASRAFAVNSGTLDIRTNVRNGTLVKSGTGTLLLSRAGSTANFSFTEGPVRIVGQNNAANVSLSGGSLLMDLGGATPAGITTTGDFNVLGGTIEISATDATVTAGTKELVRYGGNLVGVPIINIPPQLLASRMNPVVNLGTGSNSAITITSDAAPLSLTWSGSAAGGLWDNSITTNFAGGQKFFALDSVLFDDTAASSTVLLNSTVTPTDVVFDHGVTRPTYTVSGTGGISGATKLTKKGEGTTILATDNTYTGATDIQLGKLQIGNGGITGSLGSGAVNVAAGSTLAFSRSGTAVVGNVIAGGGTILNNGPGVTAFTANSTGFLGNIQIAGGTLQFGNGEADGSINGTIEVQAGAIFAIKRTGTPTISNSIFGDGSVVVSGGSPIINVSNSYTGGMTIKDEGVVRVTTDYAFGNLVDYSAPTPNAIRLNRGGIKNQDTYTQTDAYRGITITDEAYFTAGWTKGLVIDGPITGTGNVFINFDSGYVSLTNVDSDWTGVLTLGGSKPGFTGTTGGILQIGSVNNAGAPGPLGKASADSANLVFNGGTLRYNGFEDASTNRGATIQTTGTIDLPGSGLSLSGKITGAGALTKSGTGTLTLSGNSDFAGIKTITGGTVVLKSATGLGDTVGFVKFTTGPSAPAVLELATNTSVAAYGLDMAAGTAGTIQSGVGTAGPGINHTLGNFTLSSATLNVVASSSVTGGDPRVTIGSLSLSAGAAGTTTLNPTTANITLGATTIGIGNFAKTINLSGTSLNNVASGVISDGLNVLSLNKYGDSSWTLSGDNTFTGNINADDGILTLTHTNALGGVNKSINIVGDSNTSINKLPELRLTGGISPTVATATVSGTGAAGTTGVLNNLSGDNTLNITTALRLNLGNGGTTLYSTAGTFTINTPLVTTIATGRVLTVSGAGNGVINGVIGNGSTTALPVVKTGTGKWSLNGAHTYGGSTTVSQGVLSLGQAALSDTAAVTIAAGATLDLNFSGTDRVGSLTINGVVKPNGVYNSTTDPGFITGTGSIRVGAGAGYASWAASFPFTVGVNDGATNDPDGDGISNLLEYVLGGVPVGTGASNTSILPTQSVTANSVILTFRRTDLSEADVTLKVQWSDNLATWNDFATIGAVDALPAVDITEDSPNADTDTVVVTIPRSLAPGGKIFTRLQAIK